MALVFGFGGVRDFDGRLSIDPHLPRRWRSLAFSLRFQDRQLRVTPRPTSEERYLLDEGDALDIVIRGCPHRLERGQPLELPTPPEAVVATVLPAAGGEAP